MRILRKSMIIQRRTVCPKVQPTRVITKNRLYAEVALVFLLIIGVWSVVSLPVIFFHFQNSEVSLFISMSLFMSFLLVTK